MNDAPPASSDPSPLEALDARGPVDPADLDESALQALLAGTLCERMGMRLRALAADGGVMTMPVAGNTQPAGLLHGGASIALAESIASFAAIVHARAVHGPRAQAVGTSVSAVHHRSARTGTVTATCTALHLGRSVATYDVRIADESGALLCSATVSAMLLPPR